MRVAELKRQFADLIDVEIMGKPIAVAIEGVTSRKGNLRTLRALVPANRVNGTTDTGGWILRFVPYEFGLHWATTRG